MSHNGTAKRLGLDMMTSTELYALATLDYNVISDGWKSTMPNRFILDELIEKTKGRLIFNNEACINYTSDLTLTERLAEERERLSSRNENEWKNNYKTIEIEKDIFYHRLSIDL